MSSLLLSYTSSVTVQLADQQLVASGSLPCAWRTPTGCIPYMGIQDANPKGNECRDTRRCYTMIGTKVSNRSVKLKVSLLTS